MLPGIAALASWARVPGCRSSAGRLTSERTSQRISVSDMDKRRLGLSEDVDLELQVGRMRAAIAQALQPLLRFLGTIVHLIES